jgi:hypothetical protein
MQILRERNTIYYRLAHWPIWISVCFLSDGRLACRLFSRGFDREMLKRLATVTAHTGVAGLLGKLPGVEPRPYIIRFTEDKPNPLYRRVCYTLAWSELVTYTLLNTAGIARAIVQRRWQLEEVYQRAYYPIAGFIWILGALKLLPRVRPTTKGEFEERRYFYGALWSVACAQGALAIMWKWLPKKRATDVVKLVVFVGVLAFAIRQATRGILPRTKRILIS